jgi:hypothetical protein
MQFKTTLRLHFIPFRMAIIPKANNKCWWGCRGKRNPYYVAFVGK